MLAVYLILDPPPPPLPPNHYTHVLDGRSEFKLVWSRGFSHPVHHVWYGDLTHDGLAELVVVSTGGVHIMQVGHSSTRILPLKYWVAIEAWLSECSFN